MKRGMWVVAVAALALVAWSILRPAAAPQPAQINLFFTADVHGRLVPCGCFSGQLGGLTRIATMIGLGQLPGVLKVDVGDAIRGSADYEVIEYRAIQQAFAKIGYEALNVGHREAQLPAATLRELKRTSPVPMISANLRERAGGALVFEPYRIVKRGPWRIALVGVMDARGLPESLDESLTVEKMDVALGRLLPELRPKADAIVLLAFADEAAITALARQFYELDVILGGKVKQPSQQLVRENRSVILATTNQARALGTLKLRLDSPGKVTALAGEVVLVGEDAPQQAGVDRRPARAALGARQFGRNVKPRW